LQNAPAGSIHTRQGRPLLHIHVSIALRSLLLLLLWIFLACWL
jgi:hypothetical protein